MILNTDVLLKLHSRNVEPFWGLPKLTFLGRCLTEESGTFRIGVGWLFAWKIFQMILNVIQMILINLRWDKIIRCIEKGNPGANLRVTFYRENCSIGSPRLGFSLVRSMLVYVVHNFQCQHIAKITVKGRRAFQRVTIMSISGEKVNWRK